MHAATPRTVTSKEAPHGDQPVRRTWRCVTVCVGGRWCVCGGVGGLSHRRRDAAASIRPLSVSGDYNCKFAPGEGSSKQKNRLIFPLAFESYHITYRSDTKYVARMLRYASPGSPVCPPPDFPNADFLRHGPPPARTRARGRGAVGGAEPWPQVHPGVRGARAAAGL